MNEKKGEGNFQIKIHKAARRRLPFRINSAEKYLRALVIVPQIDALKRFRANNVGAGLVRRAIPLQVPRHRRLAPLSAVHGGRKRKMLALQPNIVQTTY